MDKTYMTVTERAQMGTIERNFFATRDEAEDWVNGLSGVINFEIYAIEMIGRGGRGIHSAD